MSDPEPCDAEKVANLMLIQLRRIEERTQTLMEIALRQDERVGRFERDIGEIRSEMVLMENRLLNQTQRVIHEFLRLEQSVFERST